MTIKVVTNAGLARLVNKIKELLPSKDKPLPVEQGGTGTTTGIPVVSADAPGLCPQLPEDPQA